MFGERAWTEFPDVKRFLDFISERSAAQRAEALKDAHRFKTEIDKETTLDAMYPQNSRLAVSAA